MQDRTARRFLSRGTQERAFYAFLGEKQHRSGSRRTTESYSRMIQDFFGRAGKPPDQVTGQDVFAWAHGVGLSGKEPSAIGGRHPTGGDKRGR